MVYMGMIEFGVRIGKGDGFSNVGTKKLHDVGTRAMTNTKLCIHENVTEFAEEKCLSRWLFSAPIQSWLPPSMWHAPLPGRLFVKGDWFRNSESNATCQPISHVHIACESHL